MGRAMMVRTSEPERDKNKKQNPINKINSRHDSPNGFSPTACAGKVNDRRALRAADRVQPVYAVCQGTRTGPVQLTAGVWK